MFLCKNMKGETAMKVLHKKEKDYTSNKNTNRKCSFLSFGLSNKINSRKPIRIYIKTSEKASVNLFWRERKKTIQ